MNKNRILVLLSVLCFSQVACHSQIIRKFPHPQAPRAPKWPGKEADLQVSRVRTYKAVDFLRKKLVCATMVKLKTADPNERHLFLYLPSAPNVSITFSAYDPVKKRWATIGNWGGTNFVAVYHGKSHYCIQELPVSVPRQIGKYRLNVRTRKDTASAVFNFKT